MSQSEISIFLIVWVLIVLVTWRHVRRKKPGWLGLGRNPNQHRLDRVKYSKCPNCNEGFLNPAFRWWQYTLLISTPFGLFLLGTPSRYSCSSCTYIKDPSGEAGIITPLSLSHKLTPPFFIGISVNILVGLALALAFMNHFKP
jgi:hypothetical protein